jgi:hypothetical protein
MSKQNINGQVFCASYSSMPPGSLGLPCCRRRRFVAGRQIWPLGVEVDAPVFIHHRHLLSRIEDYFVHRFVAYFRFEAFGLSGSPRRTGLDALGPNRVFTSYKHKIELQLNILSI